MSIAAMITPHLPYLRRYARALCGAQSCGDAMVEATLRDLVRDPAGFDEGANAKLALYARFNRLFAQSTLGQAADRVGLDTPEGVAAARMRPLAPRARQALLMTSVEGFSPAEAAVLLATDEDDIDTLIAEGLAEVDRQTRTSVLIIEDEPIIAMDLEMIVTDLGHDVIGIAATRADAVAEARSGRPGLVLADIQLADDSSGIDAVQDILAEITVPAIFITAFPERLLTGMRPEPTFLITKPFQTSTVRLTIAQALFFNPATVPA